MQKTQLIRLMDVFVLGPVMVYAGTARSNLPKWVKVSMILGGLGTIGYNGVNYLLTEEHKKSLGA